MCVLQEKLGYKVDSKSIGLPWPVRHAAYVLSRFVKRDDGRSAWARLRGKECDSPLAQVGETVDFKIVRGEMAKLEPSWATGTFLGRTDESDEVIVGTAGVEFARSFRRRTRDKQWQHDAFTTFMGVPWNPRGLAVEAPMAAAGGGTSQSPSSNSTARRQTVQHTWEFHRSTRQRAEKDPNATDVIPAIPSAVGDPSQASDAASTEQKRGTQSDMSKHVHQAVGMKRGAEDNPMSSSAKRAHTPLLRCPRCCRSQMSKWGQCRYRCWCQKMQWRSLHCVKRLLIRPTWQRLSVQPVSFMISTLVKSWTVMRQLLESELSSHRCKSSECLDGNASLRNHPMRMSSARRRSTKPRETRSGQELWGTEVGGQENDVEGSYTSACVTRCVSCVLPCVARERRVGEASESSQIER